MRLLHIHEVAAKLQYRNLSEIQRETGLSRPTLTELRDGKKTDANYSTLVKLTQYFLRDGIE